MFWTIAVILGLWCLVILFGITLMQAASRADDEIERDAWLEGVARPSRTPVEPSDDLWPA